MGTKGCVAFGTLPLAGFVAASHTFKAENVEALGKHCVLLAGVTAGAGQPGLEHTHSKSGATLKVPRLQAKPTKWLRFLILSITSEGGNQHSMNEETGSETSFRICLEQN